MIFDPSRVFDRAKYAIQLSPKSFKTRMTYPTNVHNRDFALLTWKQQ